MTPVVLYSVRPACPQNVTTINETDYTEILLVATGKSYGINKHKTGEAPGARTVSTSCANQKQNCDLYKTKDHLMIIYECIIISHKKCFHIKHGNL